MFFSRSLRFGGRILNNDKVEFLGLVYEFGYTSKIMILRFRHFATFAIAIALFLVADTNTASAQVVQLPSVGFFNVRTAVSVPDGGSMQIGGVNRHASGRISRGVPGLRSVPGVGRLNGNQAIGSSTSSGKSTVRPRLIIMSEMEADILAQAAQNKRAAAARDRNGSPAVQNRADFITRNIGRSGKRR